jgi:hypothetical protein
VLGLARAALAPREHLELQVFPLGEAGARLGRHKPGLLEGREAQKVAMVPEPQAHIELGIEHGVLVQEPDQVAHMPVVRGFGRGCLQEGEHRPQVRLSGVRARAHTVAGCH